MFRFIHCADIHLDSPLHGLRFSDERVTQTIRDATRRALNNLIDLAIREKVDFVLIAGDIFDGNWDDYGTGLFFNRCMNRLAGQGIPVFMIRGNHDAASVITRNLTLPSHVTLLSERQPETVFLKDKSIAIHGQSFAVRDVTENLVASYPQAIPGFFNIGLLHTGLAGREGHARYAPCQLADLESLGYDYWALGHIHQPEIVSEHPPVVYPGNIQGRHIRESGMRGCVLVTVDGTDVQMNSVSLDVLRWFEVVCEMADVTDEIEVVSLVQQAVRELADDNQGIPLCLRIHLTGIKHWHQFVHRDEAHFMQELVNAAEMAATQDVYVERILFDRDMASRGRYIAGGEDSGSEFVVDKLSSDHVLNVLTTVASQAQTRAMIIENLSEWQRGIATRMQVDVAPHPIDEAGAREAMEAAISGIIAKLQADTGGVSS